MEKQGTENWAAGKLATKKCIIGNKSNISVTVEKTATGNLGNGKLGNGK